MNRWAKVARSGACLARALARLCALAAFVALPGCYLLHLAKGQLSLVNDQVPLAEAARRERDPERRALLAEVMAIRAFAENVVGFTPSDSYVGYYETRTEWLTMILSAAPRDRLAPHTRWYPVAGRVPYRSFFDEARARAAQAELEQDGYDTFLHASPAYSTLGFFRDPVTTPMLERAPKCPPATTPRVPDGCHVAGLAETLLHELTHQHLYVPGQTNFNERLASFVGRTATVQYLAQRGLYDEELRTRLGIAFARQKAFEAEVQRVAVSLRELYARPISRAEKVRLRAPLFAEIARAGVAIYPDTTEDAWQMNNARILQYLRYDRGADEVRALWERAGGRWSRFWTLIRARAPR